MFMIIFNSILPELQYEIATGNTGKSKKLFVSCMISVTVLSFLGMLFLLIFGLDFYHIWTKNSLNPPFLMWLLFVLSIGFNAVWWIAEIVFIANNKPFRIHLAGLLASLLTVVVIYYASLIWGLNGSGIGVLFFELFMTIYIIPFSFRMIGVQWSDFKMSSLKLIIKK